MMKGKVLLGLQTWSQDELILQRWGEPPSPPLSPPLPLAGFKKLNLSMARNDRYIWQASSGMGKGGPEGLTLFLKCMNPFFLNDRKGPRAQHRKTKYKKKGLVVFSAGISGRMSDGCQALYLYLSLSLSLSGSLWLSLCLCVSLSLSLPQSVLIQAADLHQP